MLLPHRLIRIPCRCREQLAAEADVLCLLAKVDRQQFSMEGAVAGASEESGQIAVVVQEGLQVLMPMAGKALLLCLSCIVHVAKHPSPPVLSRSIEAKRDLHSRPRRQRLLPFLDCLGA